jgi:hypothetical protein
VPFDFPGRPYPAGGEEAVQARLAAQVQHFLAGPDFAQAERLADAAEGLGGRGRQGADLLRVVAQLLGPGGADRKLLLGVWVASDRGEALLDGGTDFFAGVGPGAALLSSCSPPWSS